MMYNTHTEAEATTKLDQKVCENSVNLFRVRVE